MQVHPSPDEHGTVLQQLVDLIMVDIPPAEISLFPQSNDTLPK